MSYLYSQYHFIGNVIQHKQENSKIFLYCEKDHSVEIHFLLPGMFRVLVHRPDFAEPLLEYAIMEKEWAKVPLEVQEQEKYLVVSSPSLTLMIQKSPCRIKVIDKQGFVLQEDDPGMGMGWDAKEVRVWKSIAEDEKFFGLGEKTGNLNKRGKEWVLWNTDDPNHNNNSDPLYQSIPFFVGIRSGKAYGVYFNNSYRSKFNFGAGNIRYYSFSAVAGNLDYFFIQGPQVSKVVESYTELTGRTPMPPKWSLGYQQCRWSYFPDAKVLRIAQTFRERKIPADVIYLDIHYMDGYRVFTWDKERFSDPKGLLKKLQDMGFKTVVIIDPGVKVDSDYKVAKEGLEGNHFVRYPDGELYIGEVWPGRCYFPDFSQKSTREWWGKYFKDLMDVGINGFWNDMNEPAVWGREFPEEVIFHDEGKKSSQKKMHNLYGLLMAKACYEGVKELQPQKRPFVITRAGFSGEQRYTSVWTGDNQATAEQLAMGIRMLQGLGLSGIPFIGTDVGGFGGTPTHELFARWMAASVFVPFFRTHTHYGSSDQEPWSFGENIEEISRSFIEMRYRVIPYLYSLFWESHQTGYPIIRPMFWYHQEDRMVYNHEHQEQFYVGSHILLAPVVQMSQDYKRVYLPEGKWLDYNTHKVYEGGQTIFVDAPLHTFPMFLKEGAILPFGETMQYVGEKQNTRLQLEIFPSSRSEYRFYEDDGESFEYEKGVYSIT
ncbi:MAG: glycoside hydrolase family 31 protein, partial [Candidatus Brocadiae bacterium]|nr:glycoside hydrolase family 31 protein [Candidatus Brocadiia bacterium]